MVQRQWVGRMILTSLLAGTLCACAAPGLNDATVRAAFDEKEAASARLAKSVAAYCAARFETLEDRIDCVANRYQAHAWPRAGEEPFLTVSGTNQLRRDTRLSSSRYARMFTCEHHRAQTTCLRAGRPFAEALTASH
jgi:hypothetical protein